MARNDTVLKSGDAAVPFSMTLGAATARYGLSRSALYRLMAARRLNAKKVGGRTILLVAELDALVADAPAADIRPSGEAV